jgi:hypothetical protein
MAEATRSGSSDHDAETTRRAKQRNKTLPNRIESASESHGVDSRHPTKRTVKLFVPKGCTVMPRPQFSIRTLLWLTLVAAVIAIWAWFESGAEWQVIDGSQPAAIPNR